MIVTKKHAKLITRIATKWEEGLELEKAADSLTDADLESLYHLELAGLVYEEEDKFVLSQAGWLIAEALDEFVGSAGPIDDWDDDFRWIGSEVISMIEVVRAAQGSAADQETIARELDRRGFMRDGTLLPTAESVLEAYNIAEPDVFLPKSLCEKIRKVPPGPGRKGLLPLSTEEIFQLEAMRLLTFSLPMGNNYSLTGAGQQIRAGLLTGAAPTVPITAELLFYLLEEELSDEASEGLMAIGAINDELELLPAGVHFQTAAELLFLASIPINPAVDFGEVDLLTLETIEQLWKRHSANPDLIPSYDTIRREVERKRDGLAAWDVAYSLHLLESFRLIDSERIEPGGLVYRLTEWGGKVLADRREHGMKPVFSTGVMAITTTRMENLSPDDGWVETAVEQGLVGNGYPTKSGRLFARLAGEMERLPLISAFEGKVLGALPLWRGMFEDKLLSLFPSAERERVLAAVRKLIAHGLVDALPGRLYSVTEAGEKFKRGISPVPDEMKFYVTPHILRLLVTMVEVIEREGRTDWREIERGTRFAPVLFNEVRTQASRAHFIRGDKLTTAGELLVEGVEILREHKTDWEEIEV